MENIESIISVKYSWDTDGWIYFRENSKLTTPWGKGTYQCIDTNSIYAKWGGFIHMIIFNTNYSSFASVRVGDLEYVKGFKLEPINPELLRIYSSNNKIRLGVNKDGGYVIADSVGPYDCYISAGVGEGDSFSKDFIHKYNMTGNNCYAFDGTVNSYPEDCNITFIKKNINTYNDESNTNLSFLTSEYNNIFLKMDIEGSEYPWLLSLDLSTLVKIKQITMELHGISDNSWGTTKLDKIACFKKLNITHYMIHAHGNNGDTVTNGIPDVIEITFLRKDCLPHPVTLNKVPLPIEGIDFPNSEKFKEMDLNFYPFVDGSK